MAAFAIDAGYLRFQQRLQQSAADSAAIAGANELVYSAASTRVSSGAAMDATSNGYTNDGVNVFVTVNHPPTTGAYANNAGAVETIIRKKQPRFFLGVFGAAGEEVTTRAVAALNPNLLACVYTLKDDLVLNGGGGGEGDSVLRSPQDEGGGGGGGISAHTCGVIADANLNVNGTIDARFIAYVGSLSSGGGGGEGDGNGSGTYPEASPVKTAVPGIDPCPLITSCAYLKALNVSSLPCADIRGRNPNFGALPPGRYCYTDFSQNDSSVTLAPTGSNALYVFDKSVPNGDMSAQNNAGVTIYNNSGSGITWQEEATVKLVAPTSGPTSGMVYYQPLSNTGPITNNATDGSVDFEGGFYAPGADVTMSGNLPAVSLFIVAGLTLNGSMTIVNSPSLVVRGHAVLAE